MPEVSTANFVPETYELSGDDAWQALRHARIGLLAKDAFQRMRWADGFSHGRALAFQVVLALVPGAIVAVGVAVWTRSSEVSEAIRKSLESLFPGPVGEVFRAAFEQGQQSGASSSSHGALVGGGLALVIAATTAFGQVERAANRIYGVEADRPSFRKYGQALLMALSAGMLLTACMITLTIGSNIGSAFTSRTASLLWAICRWPVGTLLLTAAFAIIFKLSPRRHQPSLSWLTVGALIGVVAAIAVNIGLYFYLDISGSFGDTYGPLAGMVGVLLWAYLSAIALLYGLSFAAQLEAFRAGRAAPQDRRKDPHVPAAHGDSAAPAMSGVSATAVDMALEADRRDRGTP